MLLRELLYFLLITNLGTIDCIVLRAMNIALHGLIRPDSDVSPKKSFKCKVSVGIS